MHYRHALLAAAFALGLAGCASYSPGYQSDVRYRDGSYYSPPDAGYGDYYYAPEPRDDYYYDYYGQDFFYGSPLYGYGGFCSVRYRYCPPFGYSRFPGDGWYAPYGFGYGYYPAPYYGGYRHRSHDRQRTAPRRYRSGDTPYPTAAPARPQAQPSRAFPTPQPRSDSSGSTEGSTESSGEVRRQYRRAGETN
jgi:hypothetical protein